MPTTSRTGQWQRPPVRLSLLDPQRPELAYPPAVALTDQFHLIVSAFEGTFPRKHLAVSVVAHHLEWRGPRHLHTRGPSLDGGRDGKSHVHVEVLDSLVVVPQL